MDNNTVSDEIQCIINRNWGIIQSNPSLHEIFQEPPMWATERLPRSRIKLLSYLPAMKRTIRLDRGMQGMFECGHCDKEFQTKSFVNVSASQIYLIRSFINWKSTYVIYRLQGPCNCFCGGENTHRLKDWLWDHKNAFRTRNILLHGSALCVILIHQL